MSRPKVPDDKRKRTAMACEFCKARKQKCNGQTPCSLCVRKNRADTCRYDPAHRRAPGGAKKQQSGSSETPTTPKVPMTPPSTSSSPGGDDSLMEDRSTHLTTATSVHSVPQHAAPDASVFLAPAAAVSSASPAAPHYPHLEGSSAATPTPSDLSSQWSTGSVSSPAVGTPGSTLEPPPGPQRPKNGNESAQHKDVDFLADELNDLKISADIYSTERMLGLALPTGKTTNLLGRSSHLAYLDALRNFLEVKGTSCPLSRPLDDRFELKEIAASIVEGPTDLPNHAQTYDLLESFFINTYGLVHVFEDSGSLDGTIRKTMEQASNDDQTRALQTLAMAIGSVMATPDSAARRININAEAFFQSVSKGHGDYWPQELWAVQAYLLMAVYALAMVRRNEAYSYLGRAGWMAQLLGMHREESLLLRNEEIMRGRPWVFSSNGAMRRNTWRSFLVLDRFVAAQLGRPYLVPDELAFPPPPEGSDGDFATLHFAVRGSEILSTILRKIYWRSETSPKVAFKVARRDPKWPYMRPSENSDMDDDDAMYVSLPDGRKPRDVEASLSTPPSIGSTIPPSSFSGSMMGHVEANPTRDGQRSAIYTLHTRLLQLHSVILLGRPFVLYDVYVGFFNSPDRDVEERMKPLAPLPPSSEFLVRDCIRAAYRSISLIKKVFDTGYLPRRNPFVLYYIFSAALIVLSQDNPSDSFKTSADKYLRGDDKVSVMAETFKIFQYMSQDDPQARHLMGLLNYLCSRCKSQLSLLYKKPESERPTLYLSSMSSSSSSSSSSPAATSGTTRGFPCPSPRPNSTTPSFPTTSYSPSTAMSPPPLPYQPPSSGVAATAPRPKPPPNTFELAPVRPSPATGTHPTITTTSGIAAEASRSPSNATSLNRPYQLPSPSIKTGLAGYQPPSPSPPTLEQTSWARSPLRHVVSAEGAFPIQHCGFAQESPDSLMQDC